MTQTYQDLPSVPDQLISAPLSLINCCDNIWVYESRGVNYYDESEYATYITSNPLVNPNGIIGVNIKLSIYGQNSALPHLYLQRVQLICLPLGMVNWDGESFPPNENTFQAQGPVYNFRAGQLQYEYCFSGSENSESYIGCKYKNDYKYMTEILSAEKQNIQNSIPWKCEIGLRDSSLPGPPNLNEATSGFASMQSYDCPNDHGWFIALNYYVYAYGYNTPYAVQSNTMRTKVWENKVNLTYSVVTAPSKQYPHSYTPVPNIYGTDPGTMYCPDQY